MAGQNNSEHKFSCNDPNIGDTGEDIRDNDENLENLGVQQPNDSQISDENSSNQTECGSKREEKEKTFSFKKFLNQDVTNYKHQNLRRKNYSPETSFSENSSSDNQSYNFVSKDNNTIAMNTSEMTSVLPDFVQDHLVIEQCYLNGNSSTINIDNLNLHNLPDLNVEHRHMNFNVNNSGQRSDLNHHTLSGGINNLPDFAVNTNDIGLRTLDRENELYLSGAGGGSLNMQTNVQRISDASGSSGSNRSSVRMPSSPSSLLDLPSFDGLGPPSSSSPSADQLLPFDLTVAAEDRNGSYRGMQSTETISKSLPDFLSDGPIQNDRLGENLQLGNLVNSVHDNDDQGISPEIAPDRFDRNRLQRELDLLRRQLSQKNRKIHLLESEIEDLRSRERTDLNSFDYTMLLQRNFKHAVERATHAERALMKSRQENNRLRSKLASLTGENSTSRLNQTPPENACEVDKSQRIAEELRHAANAAENSLRSLLTGIDNLRMIAESVENMHNYNDKTDDTEDLNDEEAASGPAL